MGTMITEEEIKERIISALSEEFELEPEKFQPSTTLYDDLGFDSLDAVDMVVVLEKTFGVKFNDEEAIRSVRTIDDIFNLIIRLHNEDYGK
jgi:acyl carrier protein